MNRCPKCGWHHTDECMGENMAADHNPAIPRTRTPILISAMRLLARDIESEDGVANAAIAEAGNRLADLEEELERSNKFLEDAKAAFKAKVDVLEADLDRYRQMVSPPEGCVLQAVDTGDGWCLEVANPATEECVALLAWPESWPETITAKQVAEFGFEIC